MVLKDEISERNVIGVIILSQHTCLCRDVIFRNMVNSRKKFWGEKGWGSVYVWGWLELKLRNRQGQDHSMFC